MRHRSLALALFALIFVACNVAGCALFSSKKQAATPAAQAVLDADAKMHEVRVEHATAAAVYFKGCTSPPPRTFTVVECNKWDTFDMEFRARYRRTGNALEAVKVSGTGQAAVDAEILKLQTDIKPYVK